MQRRSAWIVAIVLIAVGFGWIGQGSGLLRGSSFMVGDPTWAIIGAVMVSMGLGLAVLLRRHRPRG